MQLIVFIRLLLVVAAVVASSQPQSYYCKRYEAAVQSSQHWCEKQIGIFPAYFLCLFSCNKRHQLSVFDCHFRIKEKNSYPLCNDLYCSAVSMPLPPQPTTTTPPPPTAPTAYTTSIWPSTVSTQQSTEGVSDSLATGNGTTNATISSTPLATSDDSTSGESTSKAPATTVSTSQTQKGIAI
ncbi:uncharacterized protein [Drosophila pseudoobscura]|uniref:Uncharacterized protein isoform X27 n=1 Tax=Drosophila pseudoobscura pseudoobscura TaxID=46245 RepID=A0A6I8W8N0_DROPS|nr:uncharacterized protein LOC117184836 isoform X27 [Drosophila pseudoobscura]